MLLPPTYFLMTEDGMSMEVKGKHQIQASHLNVVENGCCPVSDEMDVTLR